MGNDSASRFVDKNAGGGRVDFEVDGERMPISNDLLEILCCPKTKTPVVMLPADQLAKLNAAIAAGSVKQVDQDAVAEPLTEGLVTEDGKTVYRIDDDIPVMLIDKGIATEQIADW